MGFPRAPWDSKPEGVRTYSRVWVLVGRVKGIRLTWLVSEGRDNSMPGYLSKSLQRRQMKRKKLSFKKQRSLVSAKGQEVFGNL